MFYGYVKNGVGRGGGGELTTIAPHSADIHSKVKVEDFFPRATCTCMVLSDVKM